MLLRPLFIISSAAIVTFTLFVMMVRLVAGGEPLSQEEFPVSVFHFLPQLEDSEVEEVERKKRPEPVRFPETPDVPYESSSKPAPGGEMLPISIAPSEPPTMNRGTADGDAVAILQPAPFYPSRAASRGIEGWVIVQFTVSSAGTVKEPVIIIASEPPGVFDKQAIKAVKRWKYRPKRVGGRAVEQHGVTTKLTFELDRS